jgi:hypothetical protein
LPTIIISTSDCERATHRLNSSLEEWILLGSRLLSAISFLAAFHALPYDLGTPFVFGKISQEMVSSNVTWVRGSRHASN